MGRNKEINSALSHEIYMTQSVDQARDQLITFMKTKDASANLGSRKIFVKLKQNSISFETHKVFWKFSILAFLVVTFQLFIFYLQNKSAKINFNLITVYSNIVVWWCINATIHPVLYSILM